MNLTIRTIDAKTVAITRLVFEHISNHEFLVPLPAQEVAYVASALEVTLILYPKAQTF